LVEGFGLQLGYKTIGLLAVFWCFFAFVFVNIYTSTLTSFMSVTYQRPDINSFSDLAKNPSYNVTVQKGAITEIDVLARL
jgi:hypothetical protein